MQIAFRGTVDRTTETVRSVFLPLYTNETLPFFGPYCTSQYLCEYCICVCLMCCVFPTQPPKFPKPAQTPSPRPHPDTTPPPLTDVDYDEVAADEMQEEEEEEEGGGDCQTLKVCLSVCLSVCPSIHTPTGRAHCYVSPLMC